MMKREEWQAQIMQLPVLDSHTHLNMPNVPIPAQNFWDIAHYFWFQQELWSVGYPRDAAKLPEDERIEAFVKAFNASRNTVWNHIVRHILADLYNVDWIGLENVDTNFVHAADRAIRWFSWQPDWSQSVIDKLNIRRIGVNALAQADFQDLPGVSVVIPEWDDAISWIERIDQASDKQAACSAAMDAIRGTVQTLSGQGIRGMRVGAEIFESMGKIAVNFQNNQLDGNSEKWEIEAFIAHTQFAALSDQGMFAQMFLGTQRNVTAHTAMAVDDPQRIIILYPLFERYSCGFELVIGSPGNNMDAAQAARIYPNVFLGGLWWYNFRSSTYMQTMQERLEAVPAGKSILVASDARCIEWCYGKIYLVKRLLTDFMVRQTASGWLTEEDALWVAREWLHDAAARRYT